MWVFALVDTELTVRIWLLVVGALALLTLVSVTSLATRATPSMFERALVRTRVRDERPAELERLERRVSLATASAVDFHYRLRPELVAAAEGVLWREHGVELARQPERACELLPAHVWDVVRPDLEPPQESRAPGPPLEQIESVIAGIERMAS